ncbi:MAG: cytochrome c oxidase cbb3-type subunit [Actinomycetota bacterium]|jgi:mono/diheme cytochrome c family protein|nr:cytochrome c oxidase cbb3-type subunit [Actinomycetota bacterium]
MLALTTGAGVILLILGGVFVVAAGGGLVLRSRSRRSELEIPRGMRPGPSDQALETPLLQKLQGWGVLLTAFFVLWIPYNWVTEPDTNLTQEQALKTEAIARGERAVMPYSEENQLGIGCTNCHGPELKGGTVRQRGVDPVTGDVLASHPANLSTVCGGPFTGHPLIWDISDIRGTIVNGRPDAGMPSWSIREAGALDDQQIDDLVNYLVWYSSKNVPLDQNICINPDAQKAAVAECSTASVSTLYSYQHVIKPLVDAAAAEAAKASAAPGAPSASASPAAAGSASPAASASSTPVAPSGGC